MKREEKNFSDDLHFIFRLFYIVFVKVRWKLSEIGGHGELISCPIDSNGLCISDYM